MQKKFYFLKTDLSAMLATSNNKKVQSNETLTNILFVIFRFVDPAQEDRIRHPLGSIDNQTRIYERFVNTSLLFNNGTLLN